MAIDYNPDDANNILPAGEYDTDLIKVEEKLSSKGSNMLVLTFKIFGDGKEITLKDYVVIPAALFKVKQLALALGKASDFQSGKFQPEDYVGSSMKAEVIVKDSDQYGEQNKIKKVKAPPAQATAPVQRKQSAIATQLREKASVPAEDPINGPAVFAEEDIPF